MFKLIRALFAPTNKDYLNSSDALCLAEKVLELQERIEILELENIEMTNALYECENRLDAKIDNIHPVVYNLNEKSNLTDYTLGEK